MRILFPIAQLGDAGEHLIKLLVDNQRELVDPLSEGSARPVWAHCLWRRLDAGLQGLWRGWEKVGLGE